MICPICQKRKAARFCPAKTEKICAVCCGTEREVTIDCPPDCAYLLSAHRYENEHARALPADAPLLDARIQQDAIHTHGQFLSAIAFTIAKFCATQPSTTDPDVMSAVRGLAETYKTLVAGIVYEQPPRGSFPGSFMMRFPPSSLTASKTPPSLPSGRSRIQKFSNSWSFFSAWDCSAQMAAPALAASSRSFAANSLALRNFSASNRASSSLDPELVLLLKSSACAL